MSTSIRTGHSRQRTLAALLLLCLAATAGATGLGSTLTTAGFTDPTYGSVSLRTSAGPDAAPVAYDQSAAAAVFLTPSGDLYVGGLRSTGDGNGAVPGPRTDPTRVDLPRGVRIVDAAGSTNDFHTPHTQTTSFMALDDDGGVWTWGMTYRSPAGPQLIGRGDISVAASRSAGRVTRTAGGGELPAIARIARIENQFLALDRAGILWAWGYGGENLPAPAGAGDAPLPFPAQRTTAVPSGSGCAADGGNSLGEVHWHSVWSGPNAAGAVARNGLVYTWGFDNSDGTGSPAVSTRCPALNEGANRALFQRYPELYTTADGLVYDEDALTSESARHERYADIVAHMRTRSLDACDGVLGAEAVDSGRCPVRQLGFSAGAARLLTQDGELLTWTTKSAWGRQFLGRPDRSDAPADRPAPVSGDRRYDAVAAGVSSVLALGRDGRVYGWGANNVCQAVGAQTAGGTVSGTDCANDAAPSDRTTVLEPLAVSGVPRDVRVEHIALTQCAAWARLADGRTYAWGAGTAGGHLFSQCRVPASPSLRGYRIYRHTEADEAHPFGTPITGAATPTVLVRS
ncbi:hypothetical protein [Brevibacterium salitolerans]|uniref:Alpha-tubulin suppressor n=1 Tax=Brevibacterium salitolerans TaxID=1403566 RepID=A0ABN2WD40_9MICO